MRVQRTPLRHLLLLALLCASSICLSFGHSEEIVLVEDIINVQDAEQTEDNSSNIALITLHDSSSDEDKEEKSLSNGSDDLIFLSNKSQSQSQPLSEDVSASEEQSEEEESQPPKESPACQPIDLSAFVALIPAREVQSIASHYYHHDAEVQRAYTFLSTSFVAIKHQMLQLPEVLAFTRYLNASGLDVIKIMDSLAKASKPSTLDLASNSAAGNATTTTREPLNGLHGLVDSILDILPQDQLLATFFDKTESDKQFAALVDSIGTPKFAKILSNLQNSVPLRNLIFVMHSNGIYVERIVESLKSYFFLASF
ncbi:uncharacterized protein LOC117592296 isoform X1 [Drosophila guanche]|uniref:Blast:Protein G12 n=1 Tax=Drosophila guanche TaxID=7266 RepID=A0A3B0JDX0_DROGU|nr:uncharacterized protein LOC117592296 isoform X1 [Drosophila guanche]SPP73450.1 blast:Protein G12 [Drosophila guanche]